MDFGEFRSGLDSHILELLADVFDETWAELHASNGHGIDDEVAAHNLLGRRIIAAAITLGAREPKKLKAMALEGMLH